MQPIIAIPLCHDWQGAGKFYMHQPYVDRILAAGGIPLMMPFLNSEQLRQVLAGVHGVLLPGGIDIDASLFGQEPHPQCGEINPLWDAMDVATIRQARQNELPVFAICRGIQILNVALGGTLVQDIPSQIPRAIKHSQQAPRWHGTHGVSINSQGILSRLLGNASVMVNSFHHQAVGMVAPGFAATAYAADGVIEGIESITGSFALGVQWHPELMVEQHPNMQCLFNEFVAQAKLRAERR